MNMHDEYKYIYICIYTSFIYIHINIFGIKNTLPQYATE